MFCERLKHLVNIRKYEAFAVNYKILLIGLLINRFMLEQGRSSWICLLI